MSILSRYEISPYPTSTVLGEVIVSVIRSLVDFGIAAHYLVEWIKTYISQVFPVIVSAEIANATIRFVRWLNLPSFLEKEVLRWLISLNTI